MELAALLAGLEIQEIVGEIRVRIERLCFDSREAGRGALFFCLTGGKRDGHDYAFEAVAKGAVALVCERKLPLAVPQVLVADSRAAMSLMASHFYGDPAKLLKTVTVTGTNGKTTTTYLLKSIFEADGQKCGLIGTMGARIGERAEAASLTTPDPIEFSRLLADMVKAGVRVVAAEASAHAIYYRKLAGLCADVGIFTNLTQDHLDFFGDLNTYANVKAGYFTPKNVRTALINADDEVGRQIIRGTRCDTLSYALDHTAEIYADRVRHTREGFSALVNLFDRPLEVRCRLHGQFNVYNMLAAAGAAAALGVPDKSVAAGIAALREVEGRFNVFHRGELTVIVDFAHTPDGLRNVLKAARAMTKGRLICVFGCGGNRDRAKRPIMGRIAGELADFCVVTSDNPRFEDPFAIMQEIERGLTGRYILIENRTRAIAYAVESGEPGDTVIVCGKGGEQYQEVAGCRHPYSDREVVRRVLHLT